MKSIAMPFSKVPTLNELKSGYPSIRALFFDMDGTIFNSESIHADAMFLIGAKYQIRAPFSPEVVHQLMMGKADHLVFDIIKKWEGVPREWTAQDFIHEKNKNLIEILKKTPIQAYFSPDVLDLLNAAKADRMYLALITSSEKVITKELLNISKLNSYFDLVLTRDDCPQHKPDPWPYIEAMQISGFEKFEILIFEDSHVGLEAATSSGAHVIKVEWY